MPDYAHIAATLTTAQGALSLTDEPGVFGAKKQAAAASELWNRAAHKYVGAYQAFHAPGGTGTGFIIRVVWNPAVATPDLNAIAHAVASEVPVDLIKADEKATYKGRDKKQGVFFTWQGVSARPLSQWFQQRFGVTAFATQLFAPSDLSQNTAVVVVDGSGVDHVWTLTA